MFFCEFCEIFKNRFFYRTPSVAASALRNDLKSSNVNLFFQRVIKLDQKKVSVPWHQNREYAQNFPMCEFFTCNQQLDYLPPLKNLPECFPCHKVSFQSQNCIA